MRRGVGYSAMASELEIEARFLCYLGFSGLPEFSIFPVIVTRFSRGVFLA